MDGIIIDFIKITKDDITREAGEVNEEKRGGRMGYYLDILRRREKCKNNDMSPELYEEAERLMNEEIEEAVDDLINNFKRADVDEDD
jgi:hypothetical protein